MNDAGFSRRLEMLEEAVESLKRLPDRVGALEVRVGSLQSQVLQLRTEMHDGFSAIEQRMATKDDLTQYATKEDLERFATKEDLLAYATKDDLLQVRAELQDVIAAGNRELAGHILETQRQMRVLYEDTIARIAALRG